MKRAEGTVLVVEDDETIRAIIRGALEDEGCVVRVASDGAEALAILSEELPDVVLLDMLMPGMNGLQFAAAYRSRPGPHAPIVCTSAAGDAHAWASRINADGAVSKPFELEDLLSTLGRFTRCAPVP